MTLAVTLIQGLWATYGIIRYRFRSTAEAMTPVRVAVAAVRTLGWLPVCLFLAELSWRRNRRNAS